MTAARARAAARARTLRGADRILTFLRLALAARRSRRALAQMPPAQLRDIGLSPDEARTEAARPIWDVPSHWRV